MALLPGWKTIGSLVMIATVGYAIRNKQSHGTLMKMPYDFRAPTPKKIRDRMWNPDDDRIVTPGAFGVGWWLNLYQVAKKLGILNRAQNDTDIDVDSDERV